MSASLIVSHGCDFLCCILQIFFKGREREENVSREQEYREFDRRYFQENGLQNRNICRLIAENPARRSFFALYHLNWIIHIILIIFTVSVVGSPGSWNCRSRVAGQTR